MKKGHFFIIGWVAGAGKWTLTWNLRKLERKDFYFPLSFITRNPRPGEQMWVYAHFISNKEFKKAIEAWEFLEFAFVHNQDYYGTKTDDILKNWIDKWYKVFKELEYQWMMQIEENYPDFRAEHITTLFLNVPDEIMVERMKHRDSTISEKEIQNRLNSAKKERKFRKNADYIINTSNITPEEVLKKVLNIINK